MIWGIKMSNKYSLNKLCLVKVVWLDAMSDDNTWQELNDLAKQTLRPVTSVGWMLVEDENNIILISSFDEDAQMGGGGCTISKKAVKSIVQLKENLFPERDAYERNR